MTQVDVVSSSIARSVISDLGASAARSGALEMSSCSQGSNYKCDAGAFECGSKFKCGDFGFSCPNKFKG